jgi:hypothetical protein
MTVLDSGGADMNFTDILLRLRRLRALKSPAAAIVAQFPVARLSGNAAS